MKHSLTLLFIVIAVCLSYFYQAVPDCLHNRPVCFGRADLAPFRYRILQTSIDLIFVPSGNQEALITLTFIEQSALTALAFIGLWRWLRRRFSPDRALVGCALLAVLMSLAFHYYFRSLATTFELTGVIWALLLLPR